MDRQTLRDWVHRFNEAGPDPHCSSANNHVSCFNLALALYQQYEPSGRPERRRPMPLRRYFGFVGSALLLLLFGLDWYLPQPVVEPVRAVTDKPVIRISSIEKLPERVVIDTSLPTIVPPPTALEFAERWPEEIKVVEAKPLPRPTTLNAGDGAPKTKKLAKSEPLKKVAARRPTAPVNDEHANSYRVQAAAPATRVSLLDIIKERLGQSPFKLN